MNSLTVRKLIKINNNFYKTVGTHFDASRDYSWPGWEKLLSLEKLTILKKSNIRLKILDIGCGNARFFEFLRRRLPDTYLDYTGIDFSDELLEKANERCYKWKKEEDTIKLIKSDIVMDKWNENIAEQFDMVVMFGVMHHIPEYENRVAIIDKARSKLAEGGSLIFTTWRFLDTPRLFRRILDLSTPEGVKFLKENDFNEEDLDDGDYILDWQRGIVAYRYCHYLSELEVDKILYENDMEIVDKYHADAKENDVNAYFVAKLRK